MVAGWTTIGLNPVATVNQFLRSWFGISFDWNVDKYAHHRSRNCQIEIPLPNDSVLPEHFSQSGLSTQVKKSFLNQSKSSTMSKSIKASSASWSFRVLSSFSVALFLSTSRGIKLRACAKRTGSSYCMTWNFCIVLIFVYLKLLIIQHLVKSGR